MTRATLKLARAPATPPGPKLALVKKALRLFRGRGISKKVRHANARKWLLSRERMGDQHILNKAFTPTWGQPGDGKGVSQVFAPRRLGA